MRRCLILGMARQTCHAFDRGSKRRRPDARASSRPVVAHPEIGIKPGADELRRQPRRFVDQARRQGEQRDEDQIPSHREAGRPKRDDARSDDMCAAALHGAPPSRANDCNPRAIATSDEVVAIQRDRERAARAAARVPRRVRKRMRKRTYTTSIEGTPGMAPHAAALR